MTRQVLGVQSGWRTGSRYNGKLYRDMVVVGVHVGWGRACHDTISCIVIGGGLIRLVSVSQYNHCIMTGAGG